jgi:hypothetical protein
VAEAAGEACASIPTRTLNPLAFVTVAGVEIDSGYDVSSYITNLFRELGVEDPSLLTD